MCWGVLPLRRDRSLPQWRQHIVVERGGHPKSTGALAARYDVDFVTKLRANAELEQAILQEIKASGADLVVMGVDRIQGDALNFGSVAAAVLRKSKVSVLLVSAGQGENQNASSGPRCE